MDEFPLDAARCPASQPPKQRTHHHPSQVRALRTQTPKGNNAVADWISRAATVQILAISGVII